MPAVYNYVVEETRRVEVRATSAETAAQIAAQAFKNGQGGPLGTSALLDQQGRDILVDKGDTTKSIEVRSLNVSKLF